MDNENTSENNSERPTTPEKQLLNLIEDPKGEEKPESQVKPKGKFSFAALKERFTLLGASLKLGMPGGGIRFGIKAANRLLFFVVICLFVYVSFDVYERSMAIKKTPPEFKVDTGNKGGKIYQAQKSLEDLPVILDLANERDIFRFDGKFAAVKDFEVENIEDTLVDEKGPSLAEQLISNLSIVGIGWSANPDVMIEDTTTKKIHFLTEGSWIDGKVQVKEIRESSVVVVYEGKELELR